MRTAKTPSENALSRSVVLLACGTAITLCSMMRRSVDAHQCSGFSFQEIADALSDFARVHRNKKNRPCPLWVRSGGDDRGDAAADVCFAPASGQIADRLGMSA